MFSRLEIIDLLKDNSRNEWLFSLANKVRKDNVGDEVHLRGLIEFSNICKRQCKYCGLRCENKEQAILKAKAALDKGNNTIEGSIQIVGTPYLAAGINVELKDIGYFSGKYHVKEAKQVINKYSGYTTNLEIASC